MPSYPKLRCKGKRARIRIANGKSKPSPLWGLIRLANKLRGHW